MTPDREAMVQAVAEAMMPLANFAGQVLLTSPALEAAVDALAPFIAAAEQRGRDQQAESALTEAHHTGVEDGRRIAAQAITDRANEEDHGLTAYWMHACARLARGEQP